MAQREQEENFPVALGILPRSLREDLHAVYAFARTVDDTGDRADGDRVAQLQDIREDLNRVWGRGDPRCPVHRRLLPVVARHRLDHADFDALVEANLVDQHVARYETRAELLGYCVLSANPVGRIVLGVFECSSLRRRELSDAVCTALQLLEHWQDVTEDAAAGRIYLPQEDLRRFGVSPAELQGDAAGAALRALVRYETTWAADLLDQGAPLVGELHGWARLAVSGFLAGGRATVDALRRCDGDVLAHAARPRGRDVARHTAAAWVGAAPALARRRPRRTPSAVAS